MKRLCSTVFTGFILPLSLGGKVFSQNLTSTQPTEPLQYCKCSVTKAMCVKTCPMSWSHSCGKWKEAKVVDELEGEDAFSLKDMI